MLKTLPNGGVYLFFIKIYDIIIIVKKGCETILREWCEEAGEWIGEDDNNPFWWHGCLSQNCPHYNSLKTIMEERKVYWAYEGTSPYDITYVEKFFCPIYQQFIYPEQECCFSQRK